MNKKQRYKGVLDWFAVNMPIAESELVYANPYELLVAVVLSAQCTDKRVNIITPPFFKRFPDAETLSRAEEKDIYELIRSVSYPNNKARHLAGLGRKLVNDFNGEVPCDVELLQQIPGVGRKTAHVIASVIYKEPVIAVDTHVFRVSRRIGLSSGTTVLAVEKDLTANIPRDLRAISHHWLILHGRYICIARKPKCATCGLTPWCKYFEDLSLKI